MKKCNSEALDPIGKWILELGLTSPSRDFREKTMQILSSKLERKEYQPVISPNGFRWMGIGFLLFFISVLFSVLPISSDQNIWKQVPQILSIYRPQNPIEYISLPDFGMVFNLSISFFFLLAFGLVLPIQKKLRFEQKKMR